MFMILRLVPKLCSVLYIGNFILKIKIVCCYTLFPNCLGVSTIQKIYKGCLHFVRSENCIYAMVVFSLVLFLSSIVSELSFMPNVS